MGRVQAPKPASASNPSSYPANVPSLASNHSRKSPISSMTSARAQLY